MSGGDKSKCEKAKQSVSTAAKDGEIELAETQVSTPLFWGTS